MEMYVLLWERYLNAVLVERVVDGAQHVADDIRLLDSIGPYEHLEIDAGVAQFANHRLHLLLRVHPAVVQLVDSCIDQRDDLLQIAAVGHAVRHYL